MPFKYANQQVGITKLKHENLRTLFGLKLRALILRLDFHSEKLLSETFLLLIPLKNSIYTTSVTNGRSLKSALQTSFKLRFLDLKFGDGSPVMVEYLETA